MFAKILILALALGANSQLLTKSVYGAGLGLTGGMPVYKSSANYGGLMAANGWGYGANLGRVAGIGALRTGPIVTGGALGYGSGALIAGAPAVAGYGVSKIAVAGPTIARYGAGYGLGINKVAVAGPAIGAYGAGYGLGINKVAVAAPAIGAYGAYGAGYGLGLNKVAVAAPAAYGSNFGLANLNVARGISVHQAGPVNAAVQTVSRTVDYTAVPYSGEPAAVQDIDVGPQESPLRINFQSRSSPLALTQQHIPAEPGQVQVTQSEDEPQVVKHQVVRPVYQQVDEVVQPYRSLTQTVEPVIEQTHTNIAQGEGVRLSGLTSGVVGGTGMLAASGLGYGVNQAGLGYGLAGAGLGYGVGVNKVAIAAPAVSTVGYGLAGAGLGYGLGVNKVAIAAPAISTVGYGLSNAGLGYGLAGAGLGYGYGVNKVAIASPAVSTVGLGYGLAGAGLGYGLNNAGLYGAYGAKVLDSGLYGSGLYGSRVGGYSTGLGYGLGGLSGYGTTSKITRFDY